MKPRESEVIYIKLTGFLLCFYENGVYKETAQIT